MDKKDVVEITGSVNYIFNGANLVVVARALNNNAKVLKELIELVNQINEKVKEYEQHQRTLF